jgi:hypothetical protein
MFVQLKTAWKALESAPAGRRFEKFHGVRKKSGGASRLLLTVIGALLLVGGAVLLFIPGPGLLLIAFGGALIAQQSLGPARALDRLELILRRVVGKAARGWKAASISVRVGVVGLVGLAGIGAVGATYAGYLWLFND